MFIVKTSVRAFLFALLPLLFVHGMLLGNALLGLQTKLLELPPPDKAFGMLLLRVAVDAVGLMIGHFICRGLGVGSRAAYALLGGVASAAGYAISLQFGLMPPVPYYGVAVTAGILPTLTGMVAGFVYGQFAGRERLQHVDPSSADTAPVDTASVAKPTPPAAFDGPVQVRTSIAAIFLASLVPSFLFTLFMFIVVYGLTSGLHDGPGEPMRFVWSRQIFALAVPAQLFLMTAMIWAVPCALFVAIAHGVARALRRVRGLDYAGVGALTGVAFGIALIPFSGMPSWPFKGVGFLILPLAVLGAIMMAVYRRFAGLEPRALPEPVLATEVETLVPEDHPSRRAHAVVING
jgi:hypothetical protein